MQIGIGLPNTIPGTPGRLLVEWARRAEAAGFSTLATIDRVVYPNYDSLIALAAAAGATERIRLMTNILLAPTRNPVLLAKEAASVDQISQGRLILGLATGSRANDFEASGQPFERRGEAFDAMLALMERAWKGEPVAGGSLPVTPLPVRPEGVQVMIGGHSRKAIERTVRWGIGWTAGGTPPEAVAPFAEQIRQAWKEAGRSGEPRLVALSYYALGDRAEERAQAYLGHYYAFLGPMSRQVSQAIPLTPEALREAARQFEDAGFDELIFAPTIAEVEQIEMLAEAVAVGG